jgi:hypothetical protein
MREQGDKNPKLPQNLNERIEWIGHEKEGKEEIRFTFMYIYYLRGSLGAQVGKT